jgi:hypothetical protein
MYTDITENNLVKFVFDDIQLIDSLTNEPESHGYVIFEIDPKPNLPHGTLIDNKVDIYFDFNFPIETNIANTAFGVLSTTPFETEQNVKIYPNPSAGELNIEALSQIQNVTIYDIQGREVSSQNNSENTMNLKLDVSNLSRGIYIIKIETSRGQMSQKLIKE